MVLPQRTEAQQGTKGLPVKLVKWTSVECDHTYDPFLLVNRITELRTESSRTYITISFSDHCCPTFQPTVNFHDNRLVLMSYVEGKIVTRCECRCCFSLEYVIEGLPTSDYEVFFDGKRVERSKEYYPTKEPTFQVYNGEIINRQNKYGFKEGKWMSFYENGSVKTITMHPESQIYREEEEIPTKHFYQSGVLESFSSKDTTEFWFEDGELSSQYLSYKIGDTLFTSVINKHSNRQLEEKELTKSYPTASSSIAESTHQYDRSITETVYNEAYYANGIRKFLYQKDTSMAWFESGTLHYKKYTNGKVIYNEEGKITSQSYEWRSKGKVGERDTEKTLAVEFSVKGDITKIQYFYKQPPDFPNTFIWRWDDEKRLIESPKKWKGPLPWSEIPQLVKALK